MFLRFLFFIEVVVRQLFPKIERRDDFPVNLTTLFYHSKTGRSKVHFEVIFVDLGERLIPVFFLVHDSYREVMGE
jgi:hypothetical protein